MLPFPEVVPLRHTPPAGERAGRKEKGKAAMARGIHPSPFRTGKLSPAAPMVLGDRESRTPPPYSGGQQATDAAVLHFSCFMPCIQGACYDRAGSRMRGRQPCLRAVRMSAWGFLVELPLCASLILSVYRIDIAWI